MVPVPIKDYVNRQALRRRVQKGLKVEHGLSQLIDTAESRGDLDYVAVLADRRNPKDIGNDELRRTVLGVFVQKFVKDLPGVCPELGEEVFSFRPKTLCPFAACSQWGIER